MTREPPSIDSQAPTGQRSLARQAVWADRLSIAMPLVFVLGVSVVAASWWAFYLHHPDIWARTNPTISKTAAYPPSDGIYVLGMILVCLCILITWSLVLQMNRARVADLAAAGHAVSYHGVFNAVACGLGMIAGVSLALGAVISLETNDPAHIGLSVVFFVTQVAAILVDTLVTGSMRRLRAEPTDALPLATRLKPWLCATVVANAAFFLVMFLIKDLDGVSGLSVVRPLYVGSEMSLSLLCFSYAPTMHPEVVRHFRARPAGGA